MTDLIIVLITLLFSFFFSGTEIAFVTSNKLKIALDKQQGKSYANFYLKMVSKPSQFISTMLIGNNIALVLYGISMSSLLTPRLIAVLPESLISQSWLLIIQTIISTFIVLLLAEYIPKMLFRLNPNKALILVSFPSKIFHYLFYPVVKLLDRFSAVFLQKLLGIKFSESVKSFGKSDLEDFINEATHHAREDDSDYKKEIQMFQNAMDFPTIKVRECMIPRNEVVAVDVDETLEDLRKKFIETELSRIPIYKESIDNIIGYVHSHTIFHNPPSIENAIIPIPIVPETMLVSKLLKTFIQHRKSIALVVDEFGGTSGIVTMEDIFEEIFGEIQDEHDVEEFTEKLISNNEYVFSARLEIDYLNNKYQLGLPVSEEYETLAGFIIHYHEDIPEKNEEICIGKFLFSIMNVSQTQILQVKVVILEE